MDYLKQPPQKYLFDACKLAWYKDRLEQFTQGQYQMPITIDMGIHKGCNMRCIFCYGTYQKPSMDYIPTDRLLMVAQDAGRAGVKGVAIIGDGEPTLNEGLYPFVEALTNHGVESAVATNGLLLDKQKTDILTKNCTWVRFNISAVGNKYPQIHKGTTEADFQRLKGIIGHAAKNNDNCTIGMQMVLVPQCFDQVIPMAQLGIDLGVDYVQIKQFSDTGSGMPMHFDMNRYDEVVNILKEAEAMTTDKTKIVIKWKAIEDTKKITGEKKWDFDYCVDLPFLFQMSGNGKCYPCGYLFNKDEYCYGDVTKQRLWDILHSRRYWDVIEKISKIPLKDLCEGQCRHCMTNQFMDKFLKEYNGNTEETLHKLCGSKEKYEELMAKPPEHLNFV